ncbi:GspH/FimT family pseudopilin [Halomonas sp. M4R1S46]|uniref:GspH/FimT family pseudopilin n=1 Tax=Halomonas sp. M4R1S46 TaxID=2982692 RepID=UPI0021E45C72|nr:GspH/FimT family pseudopilin [Halomonas sp. M4R1S46]UYG08084.1 GspH/FimT family pseudopilin [Halomonas sp. M4R1S46]
MGQGTAEGHQLTGRPPGLAKPAQRGLTLIELLVTLAVVILMATWGIPSFQQFTARNEVAAEVIRIKTALALARNTAITRRATISVCPASSAVSTNCDLSDWSLPILIVEGQAPSGDLTSSSLLKVMEGTGQPTSSFNRDTPLRFQSTGWSRGHNGTITICGYDGQGADIIINNMGRVRTEKSTSCQS